jgi:glycosyltransferase involved in cell wall biosynthesis
MSAYGFAPNVHASESGGGHRRAISIVTVCLNAAGTIRDAMESVVAQDYPDIEHIVIDGGSTDGTLEVLRDFTPQIARLVSEKDGGLYDAMNKGATLCTGQVIGFLNADDFYASAHVISSVMERFNDQSLGACYGDLEYVDKDDTQRTVRCWKSGRFVKGSFAKGWVPPHPSFFVRLEVLRQAGGFNTSLKLAADNDLMMRLLECSGVKTCYLPEVLVKMRTGGATNKSFGSIWRQNLEILGALRANGLPTNPISYAFHKGITRAKHFIHASAVSRRRKVYAA